MPSGSDPLWFRFWDWGRVHPLLEKVVFGFFFLAMLPVVLLLSFSMVKYPKSVDDKPGSDADAIRLGIVMWVLMLGAGTLVAWYQSRDKPESLAELSQARRTLRAMNVPCPECGNTLEPVSGDETDSAPRRYRWADEITAARHQHDEMSSAPRRYRCLECCLTFERDVSGLVREID